MVFEQDLLGLPSAQIDMQVHILSFLPMTDVCKFELVCSQARHLSIHHFFPAEKSSILRNPRTASKTKEIFKVLDQHVISDSDEQEIPEEQAWKTKLAVLATRWFEDAQQKHNSKEWTYFADHNDSDKLILDFSTGNFKLIQIYDDGWGCCCGSGGYETTEQQGSFSFEFSSSLPSKQENTKMDVLNNSDLCLSFDQEYDEETMKVYDTGLVLLLRPIGKENVQKQDIVLPITFFRGEITEPWIKDITTGEYSPSNVPPRMVSLPPFLAPIVLHENLLFLERTEQAITNECETQVHKD